MKNIKLNENAVYKSEEWKDREDPNHLWYFVPYGEDLLSIYEYPNHIFQKDAEDLTDVIGQYDLNWDKEGFQGTSYICLTSHPGAVAFHYNRPYGLCFNRERLEKGLVDTGQGMICSYSQIDAKVSKGFYSGEADDVLINIKNTTGLSSKFLDFKIGAIGKYRTKHSDEETKTSGLYFIGIQNWGLYFFNDAELYDHLVTFLTRNLNRAGSIGCMHFKPDKEGIIKPNYLWKYLDDEFLMSTEFGKDMKIRKYLERKDFTNSRWYKAGEEPSKLPYFIANKFKYGTNKPRIDLNAEPGNAFFDLEDLWAVSCYKPSKTGLKSNMGAAAVYAEYSPKIIDWYKIENDKSFKKELLIFDQNEKRKGKYDKNYKPVTPERRIRKGRALNLSQEDIKKLKEIFNEYEYRLYVKSGVSFTFEPKWLDAIYLPEYVNFRVKYSSGQKGRDLKRGIPLKKIFEELDKPDMRNKELRDIMFNEYGIYIDELRNQIMYLRDACKLYKKENSSIEIIFYHYEDETDSDIILPQKKDASKNKELNVSAAERRTQSRDSRYRNKKIGH